MSKYCAHLHYTLAALIRIVDANSYPSPLCPFCNTCTQHTSSLELHSHTHHVDTLGFMDSAGVTALLVTWSVKLAGGPHTEDRTPPPPLQGLREWAYNNKNMSSSQLCKAGPRLFCCITSTSSMPAAYPCCYSFPVFIFRERIHHQLHL